MAGGDFSSIVSLSPYIRFDSDDRILCLRLPMRLKAWCLSAVFELMDQDGIGSSV